MGSPRRSQHYCEAEAAIDAAGVRLYVASWLGMHTQHMTHDTAPAISKYINNAVPGGDCARGRHCTVSAERSGLVTTCGCLFGFVYKRKPTHLERFIREESYLESSQRVHSARRLILWMVGNSGTQS